jgi:hypothetical protein
LTQKDIFLYYLNLTVILVDAAKNATADNELLGVVLNLDDEPMLFYEEYTMNALDTT